MIAAFTHRYQTRSRRARNAGRQNTPPSLGNHVRNAQLQRLQPVRQELHLIRGHIHREIAVNDRRPQPLDLPQALRVLTLKILLFRQRLIS